MRGTLLACGFFFFPSPRGQSRGVEGLSGAAKLTAVLEEVSVTQARLKTLTARFEQRKESRLLAEPSVSRGRFYFEVPDKVRWEYETPRQMTVVAAGVSRSPIARERRAERIEVGRMQRKVVGFLTVSERSTSSRATSRSPSAIRASPPTSSSSSSRPRTSQEADRERHGRDRPRPLRAGGGLLRRSGRDRTAYSFSEIVLDGPVRRLRSASTSPRGQGGRDQAARRRLIFHPPPRSSLRTFKRSNVRTFERSRCSCGDSGRGIVSGRRRGPGRMERTGQFTIVARDAAGGARAGELITAHGVVHTPAFMPVARRRA